jgi:DnaJ-class molecular chaperone
MLRLRGQGLRDRSGNQGDLLVRVMPEVPADIRPELLEAIEKYRK